MPSTIVKLSLLAGYLALRASAACTAYGVDYSNGGSYNIDNASDELFHFSSVFQGCAQESVKPSLVDPAGHQYTCTAINTTPDGEEEKSTCAIAYSSMTSGQWKILIVGSNVAVQRTINLAIGAPSTVTVTATPTVIVGITSTPKATTVYSTIGTQTQTLILAGTTITTPCSSGPISTLTITPTKSTITSTSVIVRTTTDATVTRSSTTTVVKTAYCHYTSDRPTATICIGNYCFPADGPGPTPTATICVGLSCTHPSDSDSAERVADTRIQKPHVVKVVMATTVTVTETTFTVTSTSTTLLPTPTTTENVIRTVTATVTPSPSTICSGEKPGATITITNPQATITQTSLSYTTSHVTGTVTAVSTKTTVTTNSRSASICWANGGWMGAD